MQCKEWLFAVQGGMGSIPATSKCFFSSWYKVVGRKIEPEVKNYTFLRFQVEKDISLAMTSMGEHGTSSRFGTKNILSC